MSKLYGQHQPSKHRPYVQYSDLVELETDYLPSTHEDLDSIPNIKPIMKARTHTHTPQHQHSENEDERSEVQGLWAGVINSLP